MKKSTLILLAVFLFPSWLRAFSPDQQTPAAPQNLETLFYSDLQIPLAEDLLAALPMDGGWRGIQSSGPVLRFKALGTPIPSSRTAAWSLGVMQNENEAFARLLDLVESLRSQRWELEEVEFIPLNARLAGGKWHVTLQQSVGGIPVYGSRLTGMFTTRGDLAFLSGNIFPVKIAAGSFAMSPESALLRLSSDPSARLEKQRKFYFPVEEGGEILLVPAWWVRSITDKPDLRPAGFVNARTGEVLLSYNDVAFDDISGNVTGLVLPLYWDDEPQAWEQKYQLVAFGGTDFVYTDQNGDYSITLEPGNYNLSGQLYGMYADVNNDDGPDASYDTTVASGQTHDWLWDYDLARQDEVNMYYHVNRVHDFFVGLDPGFTSMDFPLPATVGYGDHYENAFWNGYGIYFGEGGGTFRNFALFCDVIYHEYTHGVTDYIYPPGMLPYTGQSGAMNEAWSDYFACTITDEPLMGEGGLYTNNQVMRSLDNTLKYPDNWTGEVHADGEIIGGAMWDLREAVGASVADSLLHFAKYLLAETFDDYFYDVLWYDDDDGDLSNGGPHSEEIYEAFGIHGIGPGVEPVLEIELTEIVEDGSGGSVGNGNGFFDPGEILSMTFSVTDLRDLYPPEAQNVTVTVSTDDPDLALDPESFELGNLPAGGTVQAPESLLITISPQADLAFSHITFNITANGGEYSTSDQVELIVGHPDILLVDDDGGSSYQNYLDNALRQWGQVFSTYHVSSEGSLSLEYMNEFEVLMWLTGNASTNTLTADDRSRLAQFLDSGHKLFLTGQNLTEDIGETDFFADYLGAVTVADSVNALILDGVDGDPISDGHWLMILGAGAGNNQSSPSAVQALNGAQEIYTYRNDPQYRAAAVRYDGGSFKTVFFAFGAEAISGLAQSTPQAQVLTSVLAWFGLETGIEENQPSRSPALFVLTEPFPNPFNPTTILRYQLPEAGIVNLSIYDPTGRRIAVLEDGFKNAGDYEVVFDASHLTSGVYLYLLKAGKYNASGKLVLIK